MPPTTIPRPPLRLLTFGAVGVASTVAYTAVYAVLAGPLGAQPANLTALATTAVANTAANRRLTFGVRGRRGLTRHHAQGFAVFALALGLTSGSLALLHAVRPDPPSWLELTGLTLANVTATLLRYTLLSRWVFARGTALGNDEGTRRVNITAPPGRSLANIPPVTYGVAQGSGRSTVRPVVADVPSTLPTGGSPRSVP